MSPRRDFHFLDPTITWRDLEAEIASIQSKRQRDIGIVVAPAFARRTVEALRDTGIRVGSVVAYPLGLSKSTIKAIEATSLAKDGVEAIEVTPLTAHLLERDYDAMRAELLEIVRAVRAARPSTTLHVRLDIDLLGDFDPVAVADAITRGAADGVVLESTSVHRLRAILPAFFHLERKLVTDADVADLAPTAFARPRH